jgi:hypothetical protein
VAAYASLFGGTNKINRDEGNDISRSEYANGYTLFAYDLTPDLAEDDHLNLTVREPCDWISSLQKLSRTR